ncbi:hypothetical protein ADL00_05880 [Streptomyces sp. AS58]|nr:hypothetical protein ADL00_05880 [Streptomyces sp. AS58]
MVPVTGPSPPPPSPSPTPYTAPGTTPTPPPTPTGPTASPTSSGPGASHTPPPASSPSAGGTTASTGSTTTCELADGIKGGSLTWGFKKSFRSYVGTPAGNSITAGDGLKILSEDLAVAGKNTTGTYRWPFKSSSAYSSPDDFTVQYGGSVTYSYPAHYFKIVIAEPRLTAKGDTGTLYADVSLTVSAPGTTPTTDARSDVALASVDLSDGAPSTGPSGVTRTMHTAIQDTKAFTFNGSSFYQKGEELDDATVLLSGCAGSGPAPTNPDGTGEETPGASGGDDSALVPDLQFRPGELAGTGVSLHTVVVLATSMVCVAAGLTLVLAARRRKRPAEAHR